MFNRTESSTIPTMTTVCTPIAISDLPQSAAVRVSIYEASCTIARARALVHPSRMEGGANVVIEAVRSGVPVLASRVDGNVGLLGNGYDGYFPVGDAIALAALARRFCTDEAFAMHLPEPATQLVAGEADGAADDHEVAGEPAADDRAGGVRGCPSLDLVD